MSRADPNFLGAMMLLLYILVLMVFPCGGAAAAPPAETYGQAHGMLVVRLKGIAESKGVLAIALCRSSEEWKGEKTYFKTARIAATAGTVEYVFDDLAHGEYAIRAFQDENDNHILDKDFMGVPLERYGFSTSAPALFGPPPYHKAAFWLAGPAMTLEITLK
jgi:uncharacterized protein (DUF2141 family)